MPRRKSKVRETYGFVYLDDVATQSLTATLDGGIIKNSKSSEHVTTEATSNFGAGSDLLKIGGTLRHGVTRGVEIQRQEVAESHFARLRSLLVDRGLLVTVAPPHGYVRSNLSSQWERFAHRIGTGAKRLSRLKAKGLVADAVSRRRGALMEFEVEIEPPLLYMWVTAVESYAEFARAMHQLQAQDKTPHTTREIGGLRDALVWLRGGMIPLKGRVVSHVRVTRADEDYLVHREVAHEFRTESGWAQSEFSLAGFCNSAAFWQDPSRAFMDRATFRVLARVEHEDICRNWDELEHLRVFDALGLPVRAAAQDAMQRMKAQTNGTPQGATDRSFGQTLEAHHNALAKHTGLQPGNTALAAALENHWSTVPAKQVPALARIDLFRKVEAPFQIAAANNPELEALRLAALISPPLASETTHGEPPPASHKERALRIQYIGVYW